MNKKKVRVRFAPSPTGPLHIGGVRTALYNYLFAKKSGGDFILRIEDTDQTRFVAGAESYIIESLNWCGIKFDESVVNGGPYGPYRQSERKGIYKQYADQLIAEGKAYYAFDTPEELDMMRTRLKEEKSTNLTYNSISRMHMRNSITLLPEEVDSLFKSNVPYVIRIKIPADENIQVFDLIRGEVNVQASQMDDKVLFKSDGMPTYHLANVVDDYLMKITHVIRGEEWLPSAPLHVLLYRFLDWENEMPAFAHLPLLLKPNGNGKLSKRDGDKMGFPVFPLLWKDPGTGEISSGYRESGYLSSAFVNILAMLGWNPGSEKEIFTIEDLISDFSLERVGKSGSKFDPDKAKWYNQEYLKQTSNTELAKITIPFLKSQGIEFSEEFVANVCGLLKERITFVHEIIEDSLYFFKTPSDYDAKAVKKRWKENTSEIIKNLSVHFSSIEFINSHHIENSFSEYCNDNELNPGALLAPLRIILTGGLSGPSVFDIIYVLGKKETLTRMREHKVVKKTAN